MRRGAIILAGGESRRMGRPKAWLPFGDETLLQRVVSVLDPLVSISLVVAAADQSLPFLVQGAQIVRDQQPARGPLEGIRSGLQAAQDSADAFFVSSCDVPLLSAAFVESMFDRLTPHDDIVVPRDDSHYHPLAAVYRARVLPKINELLDLDQRRPFFLFEQVPTRTVPTDELRTVDPQLHSLWNLNTPDDYEAALSVIANAHRGNHQTERADTDGMD